MNNRFLPRKFSGGLATASFTLASTSLSETSAVVMLSAAAAMTAGAVGGKLLGAGGGGFFLFFVQPRFRKADFIEFVATDAEAMVLSIQKLNAARIPVFSFVNRLVGGAWVCHAGSDDVTLAENIANYLFLRINLKSHVLVLEGTPGSMSGRDRMTGFARAFAAHPQVTRVANVAGEFLQSAARREMARVLTQGVAFDAILAANDAMALGAIDAIDAAGGPLPLITGVNAVPDAIAAIKTGKLLATASFDAMKMACLAAEAAVRHLDGKSVPREIRLPVEIVDRGNCAAWDLPFEARALPAWDVVVLCR
jgi:ribose transport system substrate-binding protein